MKIYIIIFFDFIFYFLLIDLEILNKIGINKELEIATVIVILQFLNHLCCIFI